MVPAKVSFLFLHLRLLRANNSGFDLLDFAIVLASLRHLLGLGWGGLRLWLLGLILRFLGSWLLLLLGLRRRILRGLLGWLRFLASGFRRVWDLATARRRHKHCSVHVE